MRKIVLLAGLFLLGACASRPFITNVAVPARFEAVTIENVDQEASGDVLMLQQTLRAKEYVTLREGVEQNVPVRKNAYHRIPAGEPLFRLYLSSSGSPTFCTSRTTFSAVGPIANVAGRSCLTDDDGDGRFDQIWIMGAGISNVPDPSLQVSQINDRTPLPFPPAYVSELGPGNARIAMGIKFVSNGDSGRLFVFQQVGDTQYPFYSPKAFDLAQQAIAATVGGAPGVDPLVGKLEEFVDARQVFPRDVDLYGAKVTLLGFEAGKLRYRLASPFALDRDYFVFSRLVCGPDPKARIKQETRVCEYAKFQPPT